MRSNQNKTQRWGRTPTAPKTLEELGVGAQPCLRTAMFWAALWATPIDGPRRKKHTNCEAKTVANRIAATPGARAW
eukprot:786841-Lingulodinium_polyedra.AAC.1